MSRIGLRRSTVVLGLLASALSGLGGGLVDGAAAAGVAARAPYQDPSAAGYIGLCDKAGHQITRGNIHHKPLAFRAVSSVAAPAPYNEAGGTAILLAYQPRTGFEPSEWSGGELTASTRYTNPRHPMTAATAGDDSLADFTADFHPMWDGFIQLRMYLGAPDHPVYSLHYPSLDLQISGNRWHAVGGGQVSCNSGQATSIESILLPKATPRHHPHSTTRHTKTASTSTRRHHQRPGATTTLAPTHSQPVKTIGAGDSTSDPSHHATLVTIVVLAGLLFLTGIPLVYRSRRRSADSTASSLSYPEKGHRP